MVSFDSREFSEMPSDAVQCLNVKVELLPLVTHRRNRAGSRSRGSHILAAGGWRGPRLGLLSGPQYAICQRTHSGLQLRNRRIHYVPLSLQRVPL